MKVFYPCLNEKGLRALRKEDAVTLTADLSVIDGGCCRVGDEPEAVPGAFGCRCGDGDGNVADLEEVTHEVVCGIMDPQEVLGHTTPLDVNRIDPPAHESKWPVRAEAVANRKSVKHCADVFGVKLGGAVVQVYFAGAFRHRNRPKR